MAQRFYGLNNSATFNRQEEVTTGLATTGTDLEVRIDDTKGWTRLRVAEALQAIIGRIQSGTNDLGAI
jgi:hypothetical protein